MLYFSLVSDAIDLYNVRIYLLNHYSNVVLLVRYLSLYEASLKFQSLIPFKSNLSDSALLVYINKIVIVETCGMNWVKKKKIGLKNISMLLSTNKVVTSVIKTPLLFETEEVLWIWEFWHLGWEEKLLFILQKVRCKVLKIESPRFESRVLYENAALTQKKKKKKSKLFSFCAWLSENSMYLKLFSSVFHANNIQCACLVGIR